MNTIISESVIGKIEENPVIAAVRKVEEANEAAQAQVTTVFLLHADIFNIKALIDKMKSCEKNVFIHIDFLEGIGRDNKALDYIAEVIRPDGIISTKSSSIRYAKEKGVFAIQRFFLIDSLSYDTTVKTAQSVQPDMVEIMPALMTGVIKRICRDISIPIIAGGMVEKKEEIIDILNSGAIGVSVGKKELWGL
jgi:glycerol uptake operon antiterminator